LSSRRRPLRVVRASVDQIDGVHAVLDAEGVLLRVPASWIGRLGEGDGVTIELTPSSDAGLEASVRGRLDALTKRGA